MLSLGRVNLTFPTSFNILTYYCIENQQTSMIIHELFDYIPNTTTTLSTTHFTPLSLAIKSHQHNDIILLNMIHMG